MTLAIAVCALFGKGGMEVPIDMITVNIPATIFFIALAVVPLLISKKFSKLQGVIIASSYVGYVALISFVL